MGEPVDPAGMRVSHQDREEVQTMLREAMTRGMVDAGEFDERSARAVAARTRGELNELVADLPLRASTVAPVPGSVVDSPDTIELRGWFSTLERKGHWVVPRKLVLRPRMGSAELDFTEARIDHPVVDIELDLTGGSVELRLPDSASSSLTDIDVVGGSVEDHRKNVDPHGRPHFAITGRVRWGSVELRGPRRKLFGR